MESTYTLGIVLLLWFVSVATLCVAIAAYTKAHKTTATKELSEPSPPEGCPKICVEKRTYALPTDPTKREGAQPDPGVRYLHVIAIANGESEFDAVESRFDHAWESPANGPKNKHDLVQLQGRVHHVPSTMVYDEALIVGTKFLHPGELGCFQSHVAALELAQNIMLSVPNEGDAKKNECVEISQQYFLVLENDSHFCQDFRDRFEMYVQYSAEIQEIELKMCISKNTYPICKLGNNTTLGGSWGMYALLYPARTVEPLLRWFRNKKNSKIKQDAIDRVFNLNVFQARFPSVDIAKGQDLIVPDITSSSIRKSRDQLSKGWRLENFPTLSSFTTQRFVFVVPFYNVARYITKNLESVLNQTYPTFRVVLVDDCSTDDGCEIVKEIVARKEHLGKDVVLLRNKERMGQAHNRFLVYSDRSLVSLEDVCVFLDGDDWLAGDDVLHRAALFMVEKQADAAFTNYVYWPFADKEMQRGVWNKPCLKGDTCGRVDGSFRHHRHLIASHPRFFHAALLNIIEKDDYICPQYSLEKPIPFCTDVNENMNCLDFANSPQYFADEPYTATGPMVVYNKENSVKYPDTSYYTTAKSKDRILIQDWVYSTESNKAKLTAGNLARIGRKCLLPYFDGVAIVQDKEIVLVNSALQKSLEMFGYQGGDLKRRTNEEADGQEGGLDGHNIIFVAEEGEVFAMRPLWKRALVIRGDCALQSIRPLVWVPYFFAHVKNKGRSWDRLVLGWESSKQTAEDFRLESILSDNSQRLAGNGVARCVYPLTKMSHQPNPTAFAVANSNFVKTHHAEQEQKEKARGGIEDGKWYTLKNVFCIN